MLFVCHCKILHKHCLQFLLGVKMAPIETGNNAYAKFGVTNKEHYSMLWYFWSGRNFNLVPDPRFFLLEKLWGRVCYKFNGQKFAFTTEYTLFSNAPQALLHRISQNPLPTSLKERRKTTYFVKKR